MVVCHTLTSTNRGDTSKPTTSGGHGPLGETPTASPLGLHLGARCFRVSGHRFVEKDFLRLDTSKTLHDESWLTVTEELKQSLWHGKPLESW